MILIDAEHGNIYINIKKIYEIVNIILMDLKVDFLCSFYGSTISGLSIENSDIDRTVRREEPKVGRNDPCPCGSGKKYKNCCGKNQ